jgi:hypothetical protein
MNSQPQQIKSLKIYIWGLLTTLGTLSGNWFEHLSKFVESLLYLERYKLPGLE